MYKLIAVDLDDTLLGSDRDVSLANIKALWAAKEAGVEVVICTGRTLRSSLPILERIGLENCTCINFGGAQINVYPNGTMMPLNYIGADLAKEVVEFAKENGVHVQWYAGDDICYERANKHAQYYESRVGYKGIICKFEDANLQLCPKLIIVAEPEVIEELTIKAQAQMGDRANITRSSPYFLEFYNTKTNKGTALEQYAKKLGIDASEVIAIGDDGIDLPMIKYAGLGVAVANARDYVLHQADYIAPSNNEDAVAFVINKFILG